MKRHHKSKTRRTRPSRSLNAVHPVRASHQSRWIIGVVVLLVLGTLGYFLAAGRRRERMTEPELPLESSLAPDANLALTDEVER